jgi:hypothetical protein
MKISYNLPGERFSSSSIDLSQFYLHNDEGQQMTIDFFIANLLEKIEKPEKRVEELEKGE